MLLAFCFIYGFIQEKEKKVRYRADESYGLQSSDTQKPESQNNKNSTGKSHTIFQFFHKAIINPVVIIIIVVFAVVVINFLITFAKNEKFVIESVLDYNETFNIIIAVASLITMIIIALIQHKIQKIENEKSKKLQDESDERVNIYNQRLNKEFELRENIRKKQERYNIVADITKKYIIFEHDAEIEYLDKDAIKIFLPFKEDYVPSSLRFEKSSDVQAMVVFANINSSKQNDVPNNATVKTISCINKYLVVELQLNNNNDKKNTDFCTTTDKEKRFSFEDLIFDFFLPIKTNTNMVICNFNCKIKDESLFDTSVNDKENNDKEKEYISWDMHFKLNLIPIQKVSKTGKLIFKNTCEGGVLYGNINKGN